MMSTNNILPSGQRLAHHRAEPGHRAWALLSDLMRENEPGEGKIFGDMYDIEHALAEKAITLHSKIKYRLAWSRRSRQAGVVLARYDAGARHPRPGDPAQPQSAFESRQQADDEARNLQADRHGLSPLRPEGHRGVLRSHHGARLPPRLQGRHLVRQGRHGGAGAKWKIVEDTRSAPRSSS